MWIKKDKELCSILREYGIKKSDMYERNLRSIWIRDLQLNRYKLELAGQEQATKFEKWYSLSEDISALVKERKQMLMNEEAGLDLRIRGYSEAKLMKLYKISEIREASVRSLISGNKKIIEAKKGIIALERVYGKVRGAVESGRQRKSMIRILTDLYIGNYFDKTTSKGTPIYKRRK